MSLEKLKFWIEAPVLGCMLGALVSWFGFGQIRLDVVIYFGVLFALIPIIIVLVHKIFDLWNNS